MDSVGYFNPLVPPEWIAAHHVRPVWLTFSRTTPHGHDAAGRGVCPCAGALVANAMSGMTPRTLILTTACDQMRYTSAHLETAGHLLTFLLNVPSTWQTPQARQLYWEELKRLGRFLVQTGGCEPTSDRLRQTIEHYDDRRRAALEARPTMSAQGWAKTLVDLRSDATEGDRPVTSHAPSCRGGNRLAPGSTGTRGKLERLHDNPVPLALLGGPLLTPDDPLLALIEEAGGHIVVDASESGERTLPAPVDPDRLQHDPLDELVRIYFDTMPEVYRRPNTQLYQWLDKHLAIHAVRGILLRRYPFCDLWHAELHRLRQRSDVPVLDVDVAAGEDGEASRTLGRIEAFLEMLR